MRRTSDKQKRLKSAKQMGFFKDIRVFYWFFQVWVFQVWVFQATFILQFPTVSKSLIEVYGIFYHFEYDKDLNLRGISIKNLKYRDLHELHNDNNHTLIFITILTVSDDIFSHFTHWKRKI